MTTSLLRNIEPNDIKYRFKSILDGNIILTPYHFKYLVNEQEELKIVVNVKPHSNPPSNVHVIIGRNGSGKTRILSGIADEITKNPNPARISQKGQIVFLQNIGQYHHASEKFSNLVTVVFSAFDHFKPIRNNDNKESIPCDYVGLKNNDGNSFKGQSQLNDEFLKSVEVCT